MARRLTHGAIGLTVMALVALTTLPQAVAERRPDSSGSLTLASAAVTVGPGRDVPVQDPCTSFHGYPECGTVAVRFTVSGFAAYGGLDAMESLGLDSGWVENAGEVPGWGHVTGSARVSGTVVCATTGKTFAFRQDLSLGYYWWDFSGTVLDTSTRVDDDSAQFVLLGGWDPRGAIPAGACPGAPDGSGVAVAYRHAQVSDIALTFMSWHPSIPSQALELRGTYRMP